MICSILPSSGMAGAPNGSAAAVPELVCQMVLLAFTAHAILVEVSASFGMQLAVSVGGIVAMVVAATLLTWESRLDRRGPRLF